MRIIKLLLAILLMVSCAHPFLFAVQSSDAAYFRPVSLSVDGKPLIECLREICEQAHVELEIDRLALLKTELQLDKSITISLEEIAVRDAIGMLIPNIAYPEVLKRWKNDTLVLTSRVAFRRIIPEWLEARVALDEDDRIYLVYVHDEDNDQFIARLATLPYLKEVRLGQARGLTLSGIEALARCKSLTKVQMYGAGRPADLSASWTSDDALLAISKITTLEQLRANDCGISDAGVKHLASLKHLKTLSLRQNQIKGPGLKWLAGLTELRSLDFGCHVSSAEYGKNEIADEHLRHIESLKQLTFLGTEGQNVKADRMI